MTTKTTFRATALGAIATTVLIAGCAGAAGTQGGAAGALDAAAPGTTQVANGVRVSAEDWARMSHRSARLRVRVSAEDWARMSHHSARARMNAEDWARMSHRSARILTGEASRSIETRR
jgi:hypothetical protein